jgi:hypothetical protein
VFNKTIFTMLLVIVGSLVGISSIYTPANVETQPQPQPQKPQTPLQGGIIMPPGGLGSAQDVADQKRIMQAIQDKQLLDRLMPEIIKRIDVKLVPTVRPGQRAQVDVSGTGIDEETATVTAKCAPGETIVSGGMSISPNGKVSYSAQNGQQDNSWVIISTFDGDGSVSALAECLTAKLTLKGVQQPQPQPPAQPPGGPPLQPPPEFGKK